VLAGGVGTVSDGPEHAEATCRGQVTIRPTTIEGRHPAEEPAVTLGDRLEDLIHTRSVRTDGRPFRDRADLWRTVRRGPDLWTTGVEPRLLGSWRIVLPGILTLHP
jgi:hypothetical protein